MFFRKIRKCCEEMNETQLALADYFSVNREEELQTATWEEIDAIAERIHGKKSVVQRSDVRIPYAGSPFIMADRIGTLEASNAKWEQLGNS